MFLLLILLASLMMMVSRRRLLFRNIVMRRWGSLLSIETLPVFALSAVLMVFTVISARSAVWYLC